MVVIERERERERDREIERERKRNLVRYSQATKEGMCNKGYKIDMILSPKIIFHFVLHHH